MDGKKIVTAVVGLAFLGLTVYVISWSVSKGWEQGKK